MKTPKVLTPAVALAGALALAGCGGGSGPDIRVSVEGPGRSWGGKRGCGPLAACVSPA